MSYAARLVPERRDPSARVEDDQRQRDAMVATLTAGGCEVVGTNDGTQALAQLRSDRPPLPHLPRPDDAGHGWQFMEQLRFRAAFVRTAVVVVTAYGTPEGVRSLGAADCLKKPLRLERLLEFVARYCPD